MLRIFLFLATNLAVIAVASITLSLLGVDSYFQQNGTDLNLQSLLIFCLVFGMAGSFVSLFISKWMAKRGMRVQVIDQPHKALQHQQNRHNDPDHQSCEHQQNIFSLSLVYHFQNLWTADL